MFRFSEYFTIAVLNRIERNEMDHLKAIQEERNYRSILAREYVAAIESGLLKKGRKLGRIFLMPQTFAGSRQYYQKKYADLMTIVRHVGNPTWFIYHDAICFAKAFSRFVTFTGNPKWPEIEAALEGRHSYLNRPDIVCRIFMDKATEFIRDLVDRHILGKVAGWCYSVEHQKRGFFLCLIFTLYSLNSLTFQFKGMPHIHMLLILDKEGRVTTPEQVDQFVCARVPAMPAMDDTSVGANQQRRLWHYVTSMMMHDCNKACLKRRTQRGQEVDVCCKNFPKPYSDQTVLSGFSYKNYTTF